MITLTGLEIAAVAALIACVIALAAYLLWTSERLPAVASGRLPEHHAGRHQYGHPNVPGDPVRLPAAGPPWPPAAAPPAFPAGDAAGAAPPGIPRSARPGQRHLEPVTGQGALGELVIVSWGPSARIPEPRVSLRRTSALPAPAEAGFRRGHLYAAREAQRDAPFAVIA